MAVSGAQSMGANTGMLSHRGAIVLDAQTATALGRSGTLWSLWSWAATGGIWLVAPAAWE